MKPSDKFNELTAKLIDTIENGETGEWLKPFKSGGLPKNYSTQKPYRGANVLFLWMMAQERGYKTNQWLTGYNGELGHQRQKHLDTLVRDIFRI